MSAKPRRAVLYARVSTGHQVEANGCTAQLYELRRYAELRGWQVVAELQDDGRSGTDHAREGLRDVMRLARARRIDVVAVARFDRFSRSVGHLVTALEEFGGLGVDFVATQQGIDTTSPMGRAMFQIVGVFAELEAATARERVIAGLDAARARGVVLGRPRGELTPEDALRACRQHGSIRRAADALGVSRSLVARRRREALQDEEAA